MNINLIIDFFQTYGWKLFLLALSGIVVLGTLKWVGCFNKLKSDYKKYVYFGLSCVLSLVACTIYLATTHNFHWKSYSALCLAVVGLTIVVYAIYEHVGLRALWKKGLNLIAKAFKSICSAIVNGTLTATKKKEIAVNLGSAVLSELVLLAKEKEDKLAEEEQQQESTIEKSE